MAKKKKVKKEYPAIAIRVSEELKNKIEAEAIKNKRTISDYCRIILIDTIFK